MNNALIVLILASSGFLGFFVIFKILDVLAARKKKEEGE